MWFLSQLLPHSPLYNVTNVFELSGPLNVLAVRKTLNEIVRRHEALRTVFQMIGQQPSQMILEMSEIPVPVHDLTDLPSAEREMK